MQSEYPLGSFTLVWLEFQVVSDVDAPDNQHLPIQFDLTGRFGTEPSLPGRDPARLQRASKGPGESPRGRCNNVVQRSSVRGVDGRINSIMLCDL